MTPQAWGKTEGNAAPDAPLWQAVDGQPPHEARLAPPGTVWVCIACGKTTRDRFDTVGGWDESCMLNSILCHTPRGSDGRPV